MKPISWYKSLNTPKYRRQHGCFLVEGRRAVDQVLTYHQNSIVELICTNETAPDYTAASLPAAISVRTIPALHMKSICASKTPQGIAALVRMPSDVYTSRLPKSSPKINADADTRECVLLLEHIQDPGNVGTLIRTAAAFGISGVILSDQCADPFSPKAVQSTAGSLLSILIRKSSEYMLMVSELKDRGYKLVAADVNGSEPHDFKIDAPHILALGNEGSGLSDALLDKCDYRIRIPIIASGAESLNVAVSGGILMYAVKSQSP